MCCSVHLFALTHSLPQATISIQPPNHATAEADTSVGDTLLEAMQLKVSQLTTTASELQVLFEAARGELEAEFLQALEVLDNMHGAGQQVGFEQVSQFTMW